MYVNPNNLLPPPECRVLKFCPRIIESVDVSPIEKEVSRIVGEMNDPNRNINAASLNLVKQSSSNR